MPESDTITEILHEHPRIRGLFRQMEWADEEISKAEAHHGEHGRGPIWKSFCLLAPTHDRMASELLYRSHCHELLTRTATGQDPRPATDAEMLAVLVEVSLAVPLPPGAMCLYLRLANRSIPELVRALDPAPDLTAYEELHGGDADEHESALRRKLHQKAREVQSQ